MDSVVELEVWSYAVGTVDLFKFFGQKVDF